MRNALQRQLSTSGLQLVGALFGLCLLLGAAVLWGNHIEHRLDHADEAHVNDHRAIARLQVAVGERRAVHAVNRPAAPPTASTGHRRGPGRETAAADPDGPSVSPAAHHPSPHHPASEGQPTPAEPPSSSSPGPIASTSPTGSPAGSGDNEASASAEPQHPILSVAGDTLEAVGGVVTETGSTVNGTVKGTVEDVDRGACQLLGTC